MSKRHLQKMSPSKKAEGRFDCQLFTGVQKSINSQEKVIHMKRWK